MPKAIRVHKNGGADVLVFEDFQTPNPGPHQVTVRHKAIGLNFIDVYFRTGLYPAPSFPFVLGNEGAGDVVALGKDVTDFKIGDRVAYVSQLGAYSEERVIDTKLLVKIPRNISYETAAGMMLKGLTAEYLLKRTFPLKKGQVALIHAAAGGTGQILCQWAKHLGATVIGTVGGKDKAKIAKKIGCDFVLDTNTDDIAKRVREITKGVGCDVVYDGVGKTTFIASLDSLKKFGTLASFGNASGSVDAFNISILAAKGSLYVTRPTLFTHIADTATLRSMARNLFRVVGSGVVKIPVNNRFPLAKAAEAHMALEARQTTGSTVLLP
ncbi:MAG: quinone oxidoreductase family protein [Beijerinckiaceae bacterium]